MAFLAGLRLRHLDADSCQISIPFKRLTKNPFRSMYFAAQSMAAEFSTAILVVAEIEKSERNIAMLIVSMRADFTERAVKNVIFTGRSNEALHRAISEAVEKEEAQTIELKSEGVDSDGKLVSTFWFTWSVKLRS